MHIRVVAGRCGRDDRAVSVADFPARVERPPRDGFVRPGRRGVAENLVIHGKTVADAVRRRDGGVVLGRADDVDPFVGPRILIAADVNGRARALEGLEFLGVKLDPEKNAKARGEAKISADDSKVQVWVIPTNEELAIARDTLELSGQAK